MVHLVRHRSTWTDGNYVYLQDLFTKDEARGRGVARALIGHVCCRAKGLGCARVYRLTHDSNAVAMALYDRVADRSGFLQYRKIYERHGDHGARVYVAASSAYCSGDATMDGDARALA